MEKSEVIIITAKEILLNYYKYSIGEGTLEKDLSIIDKTFKAIAKTVTESYMDSLKAK